MCISWTNKGLNIINMHSATMKIIVSVFSFKEHSECSIRNSGFAPCIVGEVIDRPFLFSRPFPKKKPSVRTVCITGRAVVNGSGCISH